MTKKRQERLIEAMKQCIAHSKGEIKLKTTLIPVPTKENREKALETKGLPIR